MLLSLDNIYLMFIADSQVAGAVWATEAAYGCRNCRSEWFRQVDAVEDNAPGPRQDWQGRQAIRHEPQGHASHTGTQCLLWMIAASLVENKTSLVEDDFILAQLFLANILPQ